MVIVKVTKGKMETAISVFRKATRLNLRDFKNKRYFVRKSKR
jgi:hypothetical protein